MGCFFLTFLTKDLLKRIKPEEDSKRRDALGIPRYRDFRERLWGQAMRYSPLTHCLTTHRTMMSQFLRYPSPKFLQQKFSIFFKIFWEIIKIHSNPASCLAENLTIHEQKVFKNLGLYNIKKPNGVCPTFGGTLPPSLPARGGSVLWRTRGRQADEAIPV